MPSMSIVAADRVSGLSNMKADGVLGMSPAGSDALLSDLRNDRQIEHKVFSLSLAHGAFTLGGFDERRFAESSLVWVPIRQEEFGS